MYIHVCHIRIVRMHSMCLVSTDEIGFWHWLFKAHTWCSTCNWDELAIQSTYCWGVYIKNNDCTHISIFCHDTSSFNAMFKNDSNWQQTSYNYIQQLNKFNMVLLMYKLSVMTKHSILYHSGYKLQKNKSLNRWYWYSHCATIKKSKALKCKPSAQIMQ